MVDPAGVGIPPFRLSQDDVVLMEEDLILTGKLLLASEVYNEGAKANNEVWV